VCVCDLVTMGRVVGTAFCHQITRWMLLVGWTHSGVGLGHCSLQRAPTGAAQAGPLLHSDGVAAFHPTHPRTVSSVGMYHDAQLGAKQPKGEGVLNSCWQTDDFELAVRYCPQT
jgi:hypothetical protein